MEAATLTPSSTLQIDPFRLFTCTGLKPTITINPRNRTMTFYQPTLFPHGHLQVMCGHKPRHVAHVVRAGREMNDGDDGKRARGVVGPTVVLACVLGTMCVTLPMCRPSLANAWQMFPWSAQEEKAVTRAKPAGSILKAFMEMEMKSVNINTEEAQKRFDKLAASISNVIPPEQKISRDELKEAARKLVLSGKTDEAVEKLQNVYKYPELKPSKTIDEELNYYCGLVLVEMLIYQGKFHEAKRLVLKLEPDDVKNGIRPSDLDPKLYKAAIYLILGDDQGARKSWNEYEKLITHGIGPGAPPLDRTPGKSDVIKFEEFKGKIIWT